MVQVIRGYRLRPPKLKHYGETGPCARSHMWQASETFCEIPTALVDCYH